MSNQRDSAAADAPSAQPGPDVLTERTLTGIFVHVLGLLTGFVLPGVVYLVSDHEFTRANARNAFNWQLFYAALTLAALLLFGAAILTEAILPDVVGVAVFLAAFALFFVVALVGLLDLVFILIATGKAIFGTPWVYPIAPDFFDRGRSTPESESPWWTVLVAYAVVAPVALGTVVWFATTGDPGTAWAVGVFLVTLVLTMILSVVALAGLYRDATVLARLDAAWQPNWVPYLAIPLGVGVLTYFTASFYFQSANPGGDAVYGYLTGLWVTSTVYLYRRYTR